MKNRNKIVHKLVTAIRKSYQEIDKKSSLFTNDRALKNWQGSSTFLKAAVAKIISANEQETNDWC